MNNVARVKGREGLGDALCHSNLPSLHDTVNLSTPVTVTTSPMRIRVCVRMYAWMHVRQSVRLSCY